MTSPPQGRYLPLLYDPNESNDSSSSSSSSPSTSSSPSSSSSSSLPTSPDDQQIYDDVGIEETDSWLGNFRNNVRCLVKNDENQTLKGRLNHFLMNEELADVHFIVMDEETKTNKKVPAHKFILAAGSCVFKAMFYGLLSNGHNEIQLSDIDYSVLANLLKFLYIDEADISPSNLVTTLYAAKKYQVMNLEKACVNYLSWSLSSDNVLLVLSQAILFDEHQLIDLCWEKIEENIEDVIAAPTFELTDYSTLVLLLKRNSLALKEVDLYKACLRWAKSECNRKNIDITAINLRSVLGEALYLIRFPTMTGDEFAFNVCDQNILHDDEVTSVFSFFAYPQQNSPDCKKFFTSEPRTGPAKRHTFSPAKEIILSRFEKSAGGRFCMFDEVHKVDFIVNHPIYITGLGVYGTRCNKGERIIYIELRKSETSEILSTGHSKITCTGKPKIYQVRFRVPSLILPNTIYTASAEFDGSYPYPTYYGINGRRICYIDIPIKEGEADDAYDEDSSWDGWLRNNEDASNNNNNNNNNNNDNNNDNSNNNSNNNNNNNNNNNSDNRICRSKKKRTKQVLFVFFKSEKNSFLDTGGEQGQIPQIMFHA